MKHCTKFCNCHLQINLSIWTCHFFKAAHLALKYFWRKKTLFVFEGHFSGVISICQMQSKKGVFSSFFFLLIFFFFHFCAVSWTNHWVIFFLVLVFDRKIVSCSPKINFFVVLLPTFILLFFDCVRIIVDISLANFEGGWWFFLIKNQVFLKFS